MSRNENYFLLFVVNMMQRFSADLHIVVHYTVDTGLLCKEYVQHCIVRRSSLRDET